VSAGGGLHGEPLRSFSGTHPFRPAHLLEQTREGFQVATVKMRAVLADYDAPCDDEVVTHVARLVELIDGGYCPRCERPLGALAGSRLTPCRCIPICSRCGRHEAFCALYTPNAWPLDEDEVEDELQQVESRLRPAVLELDEGEMTLLTEEGVGPPALREHPGGWAEFGHDDPAEDDDERRGR
jgi:hypothetical protein